MTAPLDSGSHPQDVAQVRPSGRRGRRPAGEDTRTLILTSARAEFGSRGYDGTTMRQIARTAGVDARLVHHYFAGKQDVFVAAMGFPARPQDLLAVLISGPREELGERLALTFLQIWDSAEGRGRILGLLSGAMTNEAVARMLREFLARELLGRIAAWLQVDHGELRAALAAAHLVGIEVGRVVIRIEPLAELSVEELAKIVGPALQRYLTEPLP